MLVSCAHMATVESGNYIHPKYWIYIIAIRMILSNSGMSFPIYLKTLPQFKEGFLSIISIHGAQAPAAFSRRMQVSPAKQPPVSWW